MNASDVWKPSSTLQTLRLRAAMLRAVRQFFEQQGYLEVETPCLSRDIVIDAWLEPIVVQQAGASWYLQTSPEACMKRLLAAGSGSIFQISRVFRSGELGDRHNPEFTMIEWYGVDTTWEQQIELTELLVRNCLDQVRDLDGCVPTCEHSSIPFVRTSYAEAFQRAFQISVHTASGQDLLEVANRNSIPLPDGVIPSQRDDLLNAMLAFAVEPRLGTRSPAGVLRPEFLYDYPPSQAALAVTSHTNPPVARRFELYIDGIELCNGYQELTDTDELERREKTGNEVRSASDLHELPGAKRLAAAMRSGLPQCAGVALGFDRLVMITAQTKSISEVIAFPAETA